MQTSKSDAGGINAVRARRRRSSPGDREADNRGRRPRGAPVEAARPGKLKALFHWLTSSSKAAPESTVPLIECSAVSIPFTVFLRSKDVVLSVLVLCLVTGLLVFSTSDARFGDLMKASRRNLGYCSLRVPRVVSADLVLLLLSSMAANSCVLAFTRVVEEERKKEVTKRLLEELHEAYDTDPEKQAAFQAKQKAAAEARAAKFAAFRAENEAREGAGKRPLTRITVSTSEIVEEDSVVDAILPIAALWPVLLGFTVVLRTPNAIRGLGAVWLLAQMSFGAVLAKVLDSTTAARNVINVMQNICQLLLAVLVGMQWWYAE